MGRTWILAAERRVNGQGSLEGVLELEQRIDALGAGCRSLVIDPLKTDWHSPLEPGHFRSGCAPLEALAEARQLIGSGACDAVVIHGRDYLASEYDRLDRQARMAIYGPSCPLTQAYNDLAEAFLEREGVDLDTFIRGRDALYDNYERTYRDHVGPQAALPAARWFEPVTPLFRGVDCANPVVDFEARVLLCSDALRERLGRSVAQPLLVAGVGLGLLDTDGPGAIEAIAGYGHLRQAFQACQEHAAMDIAQGILDRELLLEVYSCYPVVPMAFLLRAGLAPTLEALPDLLAWLPVTVSGGMNLGRAPWNNPALNGLVILCDQIRCQQVAGGVLHGNGGLGYRQGVAVISRSAM